VDAEAILYRCLELGLSFKVSDGNVLALGPPLTIRDEEMTTAIEILAKAIGERV
jgi:4-aminobutyrate aminotransferase